MKQELDSQKYTAQAEALYQEALEATIALLKANGNNRYIAIPDWEDEVDTASLDDVFISIWGVGLNDEDHICIKAVVDYSGYGYLETDYPQDWADITEHEIYKSSYPDIYRFVVDNLAVASDKATADIKVALT